MRGSDHRVTGNGEGGTGAPGPGVQELRRASAGDILLLSSCPKDITMEPLTVSLDFLEFPPTHTCDGENLSPAIRLNGLSAASVAVMVFNPFEKSCCSFTPWICWNLPRSRSSRPA